MHRSRAFIAFALTLTLICGVVAPAGAATRSDLNRHRDAAAEARKKAAAADAKAKQLASEVKALDQQIDAIQKEADALGPGIAKATRRTNDLKRQVAGLEAEAAQTQANINRIQADLETQRGLLAERVESTYRQGDWFYLDILLGSKDFGELVTRTELVQRVIEANNDAAEALNTTRDSLSKAKAELDRSLKQTSIKKAEAQAAENELRGLQSAKLAAADRREAVQGQKADLMADSKRNAARLRALAEQEEAESDRIAAELRGGGSGRFAGTMTWPVPSSHRVTSPYGWRICPFHGRELHPGIDIGRASAGGASLQGAAIVAASGGRVIYAGYRGGYGNTVMIDHGNGVVTLYAHQSSIAVSNGQRVTSGQRVGAVGSTGNSTGPHLHFEVRVNGTPKNPMGYM